MDAQNCETGVVALDVTKVIPPHWDIVLDIKMRGGIRFENRAAGEFQRRNGRNNHFVYCTSPSRSSSRACSAPVEIR